MRVGGTNQNTLGGGGSRAGRKHGSVSMHLVVLMVGAPTLVGEPIRTSLRWGSRAGRKHGSVSMDLVVLMVGAPTLVGEPIRTSLGGGGEEGKPGGNMVQSLCTWWC